MAEICPFLQYGGWIYCHNGRPSIDEHTPNSEHTCKAWICIGYDHSGGIINKPIPIYGCGLIEVERKRLPGLVTYK